MFTHIPVLLKECIDGLNIRPDGIYVDATLGRGGHASEILSRIGEGTLYCFDRDSQALTETWERLNAISSHCRFFHANFSEMKQRLSEEGIHHIDGAIFDLGVSSAQFDDETRGFSYRYNARLDMRMNRDDTLTAYDVINTYSLENLLRIFREYGETECAYPVARAIVRRREQCPITTTWELVEIIRQALPQKVLAKKGHPAKQFFQAVRIEVNGELDALKSGLRQAIELLNPQGRICVITFNSLEDRIVKNLFREYTYEGEGSRVLPVEKKKTDYRLVYRKIIVPSSAEMEQNPRSRSAKLRMIERKQI